MKLERLEDLTNIEKLIIIRKRFNISQFQFAEEIGISASYFSQIERGKYEINNRIQKLVRSFILKEKKNGKIIEVNDDDVLTELEKLIILRKRLKMNQAEFATKIGFSTSYLGQVERGKCPVSGPLKQAMEQLITKEDDNL